MIEHSPSSIADLAQLVLSVARDIRMYGTLSADVVEITSLESLVLSHISQNPGISPTRIAAEIGLRSANVSAVLRSLTSKGLVERRPDGADGRAVVTFATPLAEENLRVVRADWAELLTRHLPESADLDSTIRLLRNLDQSFANRAVTGGSAHVIPRTLA